MLKRLTLEDSNNLTKLKDDFNTYCDTARYSLGRAANIVENNKPSKKVQDDIDEAASSLKEIREIYNKLSDFQAKFKKLQGFNLDFKTLELILLSQERCNKVITYIVQLNTFLTKKHIYAFKKEKNKENKSKLINKALIYINITNREYLTHKDFLTNEYGASFEKEIAGLQAEIEEIGKSFIIVKNQKAESTSKPSNKTEIESKLEQARNSKDKDNAYQLFHQVVEMADKTNDLALKFTTLYEQGTVYGNTDKEYESSFVGSQEVEYYLELYKKSFIPYKNAVTVLVQLNDITNPIVYKRARDLYSDLEIISRQLFRLSTDIAIKNNLEKQEEILKEALNLIHCGRQIPVKDETITKKYSNMEKNIAACLAEINKKRAKNDIEQVKKQRNEEKNEKLELDYDKRFSDLLKEFTPIIKKEENSTKTKSNALNAGQSNESPGKHEENSTHDNNNNLLISSEEKLTSPIETDTKPNSLKQDNTSKLEETQNQQIDTQADNFIVSAESNSKVENDSTDMQVNHLVTEEEKLPNPVELNAKSTSLQKPITSKLKNSNGQQKIAKKEEKQLEELEFHIDRTEYYLNSTLSYLQSNTQDTLASAIAQFNVTKDCLLKSTNLMENFKNCEISTLNSFFPLQNKIVVLLTDIMNCLSDSINRQKEIVDCLKRISESTYGSIEKYHLDQLKNLKNDFHHLMQHVKQVKNKTYSDRRYDIEKLMIKNHFLNHAGQRQLTRSVSCESLLDPINKAFKNEKRKGFGR